MKGLCIDYWQRWKNSQDFVEILQSWNILKGLCKDYHRSWNITQDIVEILQSWNVTESLCKDYRQSWNITLGTHEEWVRAIGPKRNIQGNIWIADKYSLHSTKEKKVQDCKLFVVVKRFSNKITGRRHSIISVCCLTSFDSLLVQ